MWREIRIWVELRAKTRALVLSQAGVAAVEFAFLAPVLLLLYLGSVDLSQGIDADRKLTYLTHTVGDLTSQMSGEVTADDLEALLALGDTILRPFDASRVSIKITVANVNQNGSYTLHEPVVRQGSSSCSNPITLPQTMIDLARGRSIIATEGCYDYTPVVGYAVESDIPLYKRAFHVPRSEDFVFVGQAAGSGSGNCAGNSGGHGQGNNCNNPNQSHNNNGNGGNGGGNTGGSGNGSGNGNGGGNDNSNGSGNSGGNGGGGNGSGGGNGGGRPWYCAVFPFLCR